jgi:hypothetical protein
MKLELLNVDKFVRLNDLSEISNPITLSRGFVPTSDGLLSTDIFGTSTEDRKRTFAYIDLHCHVLHPLVYKCLKRMDKRITNIIAGTKNFSIDKKGQFVEDENGGTGLDWLYSNWNKIKWLKKESRLRNERVDFLNNHDRDTLFQSKEVVCPAFYRDINLQSAKSGKPSLHVINNLYSKLISLSRTLDNGDFAFNLNYTKAMIQEQVVAIYDEFKARVEKKHGIVKQKILAKSTDYGARLVISSPNFAVNSVDDMEIDFYHCGLPLSYCVSLFAPFFVGWIQNFFRTEFELLGGKYLIYDKKIKDYIYVELEDPDIQFSDEAVNELMQEFLYSYDSRYRPLRLKTKDKNNPEVSLYFTGRDLSVYLPPKKEEEKKDGSEEGETSYVPEEIDENISDKLQELRKGIQDKRYFTITDLFYLAAVDITADKHVYITRYPMTGFLGIFPSRIRVISTTETKKVEYDGKIYEHYPVIGKPDDTPQFIEILRIANVILKVMGGDYDGEIRQLCG